MLMNLGSIAWLGFKVGMVALLGCFVVFVVLG